MASSFSKSFDAATKAIIENNEKIIRGAALQVLSEIVRATPVGNKSLWKNAIAPPGYVGGRLRANWQANTRTANRSTVNNVDPSGTRTINNAELEINKFKGTDKEIWLSNNLPYAERVENGWSRQRPQGMVKTVIARFKDLMATEARKRKL